MVWAPCGECQSTWSLRTVAAPSQTKGLRLGCASLVQATVIGSLLLLFRCRNSFDYSVFLYHTNCIRYEDFFHENDLVTLPWSVFASNIGTSVHLNGSHIPLNVYRLYLFIQTISVHLAKTDAARQAHVVHSYSSTRVETTYFLSPTKDMPSCRPIHYSLKIV